MKRRSFLGLLAASPIAAKGAAKAAAEKAAADVSAMELAKIGIGHAINAPSIVGAMPQSASGIDPRKAVARFLRMYGVPKWKEDEMRQQARNVHAIHPSIGVLRSTSLVAKHRMQVDRNYESLRSQLVEHFHSDVHEQALRFRDKFGWWL